MWLISNGMVPKGMELIPQRAHGDPVVDDDSSASAQDRLDIPAYLEEKGPRRSLLRATFHRAG